MYKLLGLLVLYSHYISVSGRAFVDPNVVLQPDFKGWGTSLAWWADMVGGMDQEIFNHVVDAVFSPSKLNLNIARYVIGGTSPGNYTCGDYRYGGATESFRDGLDSPYDWSRDLRQRKTLEAAKALGANVFEAFSNSPPQWLTISGCSKGNPQGPPLHSNFDPVNAPLFADYVTEVIKYFHNELNVTFTTYSPFNEPFGLHGIGGWVGEEQTQEGCNMNRPTMTAVIQSVHEVVTLKNLTFLKIAVSDETQVNTQIQSYDYFTDAGVASMFSQVNVHGYWDDVEVSRKDLLSLKCNRAGHELWMDEMGWSGTPANDMEQALNLATRIILDLRNMLPSAWVYWQAVAGYGGWGFLQVPFENTTVDKIIVNSGFYAMQQFSQHVKPGYQLIFISDENSIAAFENANGESKLVVVTLNPTSAEVTQELDLRLFSALGTPTLFRTSAVEQHLSLPPPPSISAEGLVTIQLPPESISTLEFSGVTISSYHNILRNGDFEETEDTGAPVHWQVVGESAGVTAENAWRGMYSGVLQTRAGQITSIEQSVTLPQNGSSGCSLYLSAWCLSTQPGTKLIVTIGDKEESVSETDISRNGAFSSYGLSFTANSSDTLKVRFQNTGSLLPGTAKLDSAFLHTTCV